MRIIEVDREVYPKENINTAAKLDEVLEDARKAVEQGDYLTAIVNILKWKPRATTNYLAERFLMPEWELEEIIDKLEAAGKIMTKVVKE